MPGRLFGVFLLAKFVNGGSQSFENPNEIRTT
jgi:hypothetical protein